MILGIIFLKVYFIFLKLTSRIMSLVKWIQFYTIHRNKPATERAILYLSIQPFDTSKLESHIIELYKKEFKEP